MCPDSAARQPAVPTAVPSTLPCIAAARRFDARAHLPFFIGARRVGWVRRTDAPALRRWPDIFELSDTALALAPRLATPAARSDALAEVIRRLADDGTITGWRDEIYAVRNHFDAAPLAFIERAAARFFGTMTYAVHANGIVAAAAAPALWIARRSMAKATDPGMLDSLVGGGIGWGYGIRETLVKECWEESGVPPALVATASAGSVFYLLAEIEQGTQAEQLFVFDLDLPPDFTPVNQDGEVSEHRIASVAEVVESIAAGALTIDAGIVTLDCLVRRGWIDPAICAGLDQLRQAPHNDDRAEEPHR